MAKRLFLAIVCFTVCMICSLALVCQNGIINRYSPQDDGLVKSINRDKITFCNDCSISNNGNVTVAGEDPYIVIENVNTNAKSLFVKFMSQTKKALSAQIFFDIGSGYTEDNSEHVRCFRGDNYLYSNTKVDSTIKNVRIDVDEDYTIDSILMYSTPPKIEGVTDNYYLIKAIACSVFSLIITIIVLIVDFYKNFTTYIINKLIENHRNIIVDLLLLLGCLLISYVVEWVYSHYIYGLSSIGSYFNIYRYFFIVSILVVFIYFIKSWNSIISNPEKALFIIVFFVGMCMVVISPFAHTSWDTDTHYRKALNASYIGEAQITQADLDVFYNNTDFRIGNNLAENTNNIISMNDAYKNITSVEKGSTWLSHIPSGVFIAVARMLGKSFYQVYTFGKVANLLIYSFVCYFGMKRLKSGKMIFAVIALLPTNLFLATTYSYDYWVTCFSMLGIAYFIGERQRYEEEISTKNTVIMCGSLALACIPKLIYVPLMFIPFFMKKKELTNKRRYYTICILSFVLLLVFLLIRSLAEVTSVGDLRGGGDVSPKGQIIYILQYPLTYAKVLIKFMLSYLSINNMSGYITNYAYLGIAYGSNIFIALMVLTALTDKDKFDIKTSSWIMRSVVIILYFGLSVLIATALYISFTPVSSSTINGCQPRYIIPLLYPALAFIGPNKFKIKINKRMYNYFVLVLCSGVLYYSIYTNMLTKML